MANSAASDAPTSRSLQRVPVALFLIALFAGFSEFGAVASLADVAKHFGHVTSSHSLASVVGLSGSVLGVGLAILRLASLGALPLSALADRWGRRAVLRLCMVLGLFLTALAAASPGYWFFVACFALGRPLLSAAAALVQVLTVELASTAHRIQRLAYVAAGSGAGAGLAAILHGVVRGPDSFRWLFALSLVPLVLVLPVSRALPPHEPATAAPARLGWVPRSHIKTLVIVAVVTAVIGVISGPANGFVFVYGESLLKMAPGRLSLVVGASAVTGLLGLFASHLLARLVGRRWTLALGIVASGLAATLAYSGGKPAFIVGYMLGVGAGGLLTPAATAIATELFPRTIRATAAGWVVVASVVGATAGLALFGWLADAGHAHAAQALRWPALVTFVPVLALVGLLAGLPESSELDLT